MITVPLRHGTLILDDGDAWVLGAYWRSKVEGRQTYAVNGKGNLRLHRVLLSAPAELMVDHVNGNGLDNRRANIRLATNQQNQGNRHVREGPCYKGVTLHRQTGKWQAALGRERGYLGLFDTPEAAAIAYADAAEARFGEFANHDRDAALAALRAKR